MTVDELFNTAASLWSLGLFSIVMPQITAYCDVKFSSHVIKSSAITAPSPLLPWQSLFGM